MVAYGMAVDYAVSNGLVVSINRIIKFAKSTSLETHMARRHIGWLVRSGQ